MTVPPITYIGVFLVLSGLTVVNFVPDAEAASTRFSSDTVVSDFVIEEGETIIIEPGVTLVVNGSITNHGNITNHGLIELGPGDIIHNYGKLVNLEGSTIYSEGDIYSLGGSYIINYESGLVRDEAGAGEGVLPQLYFQMNFDNYGNHTSHASFNMQAYTTHGIYRNFDSGTFESFGRPGFTEFLNHGGEATYYDGAHLAQWGNVGGGILYTNGTIHNYGFLTVAGTYPGSYNIGENGILNNYRDGVLSTSHRPLFGTETIIEGTLNNDGTFTNVGHINNTGSINNDGLLENLMNFFGTERLGIIDNKGKITNTVNGNITNFSTINNLPLGIIENNGLFANECEGVFNNEGSFVGNPIVEKCPSISEEYALTIISTDLYDNPITGMWTTIRSFDGALLTSGFTPLTFTGDSETSYIVRVENYDGKIFDHWQDDGSIDKTRTVTLTDDTTITAVYDTGDSLRGFTSLTYTGTSELPDLTVDAVSTDGNQTLHMWTVIDPQTSGSLGTTYSVYATNGYQNKVFDHWEDGSTDRVRTLTISEDTTLTAYYRTG